MLYELNLNDIPEVSQILRSGPVAMITKLKKTINGVLRNELYNE